MPADFLFVGEAPGREEDELGKPFVGQSGRIFNRLLDDVVVGIGKEWAVAYAKPSARQKYLDRLDAITGCVINTVGCIPLEAAGDQLHIRPPEKGEIEACLNRGVALYEMIRPQRVVLLGKSAETWWKLLSHSGITLTPPPTEPLVLRHPAFIARNGGVGSAEYHKNRMLLQDFILDYLNRPQPTKGKK
jgi:DNA polymerase